MNANEMRIFLIKTNYSIATVRVKSLRNLTTHIRCYAKAIQTERKNPKNNSPRGRCSITQPWDIRFTRIE